MHIIPSIPTMLPTLNPTIYTHQTDFKPQHLDWGGDKGMIADKGFLTNENESIHVGEAKRRKRNETKRNEIIFRGG
jgi:hypothetical protein